MLTGHVYIATSLDGFIARLDGSLDWLPQPTTDGEDHGFSEFQESVDGLIMGRGTFVEVLKFDAWPYSKPVVVLSSSLSAQDIPEHLTDRARILNASPKEVAQILTKEGWKRAYVDGGKVIQSFLNDGLIKDMTLTRIPILIGSGLPLFGQLNQDIDLKHLETNSFSGFITSKYEVIMGK